MIRVTDAVAIDDREIEERFVRGSGPGGQNVNKVATAVELRFDIGAAALPPDVKERLIALAGNRVTAGTMLFLYNPEHPTPAPHSAPAPRRAIPAPRQTAHHPH